MAIQTNSPPTHLPTPRKDCPGPTQLYPKAPFPPHHSGGPHLAPGCFDLKLASDLQQGARPGPQATRRAPLPPPRS